jgi:hypothetical protein
LGGDANRLDAGWDNSQLTPDIGIEILCSYQFLKLTHRSCYKHHRGLYFVNIITIINMQHSSMHARS